jgi:hypothetical protein
MYLDRRRTIRVYKDSIECGESDRGGVGGGDDEDGKLAGHRLI